MPKSSSKELVNETFSNIRKDWEIIMYLSPNRDREIGTFVNNNDLLQHWRFLNFKSLFIEIIKVVNIVTQKETGLKNYKGSIIDAINDSDLTKREKAIQKRKLIKLESTILKIKNARDKFYAHLDGNYRNFIGAGVPMEELRKLVFVIQGIISNLYGKGEMRELLSQIPSRDDYTLVQELMN